MTSPPAAAVLGHWLQLGDPRLVPARGGHINTSFLVADGIGAPGWLLQRLNRQVFPAPVAVMRNIEVVLAGAAALPDAGIMLPTLLRTLSGDGWVHDDAGDLWRCWEVMPNARSTTQVLEARDAREAGRAFGAFARLATTLEASRGVPAR